MSISLTGRNNPAGMHLWTMTRRMDILNVPVMVTSMENAVASIGQWIDAGRGGYVCAADMNSIMQAQRNASHMDALQHAAAVLPDGTPLVWAARMRGQRNMQRVPGPDIMLALCEHGVERGWRHYFYGGAEGVAGELAASLQKRMPGLCVAGMQAPPFRPLSPLEKESSIAAINAARPHVVWVGLGCPKQEIWMRENAERIAGAIVIGVGAAFNFHSDRIRRAPAWMRRSGLEWLHRLASEPRRLWRRYLLLGPEFVARATAEAIRMRVPPKHGAETHDEGR